ncbi:cytochrome P450 [Kutzneria kofuensis]|uniref:Cytochrome P450 n=1 Tax=Kutzneria kofuensis TaxID=103725 RepID=A0A7W9KQI3_9PSEU|nr:cytochrome P450 [Kutzneria kofuensis]MBB5896770.1 cytochrome P450 [Kutzneria kofuensis]
MADTELQLPGFPMPRTDPLAPPPAYALWREGPPRRVQLPLGDQPWLLTRHADVRAALADARLSADSRNPKLPRMVPLPPGPSRVSFLRMDDPEHGVLRRMLTPEFTLRRVNEMRPGIQQTVDRLIAEMAAVDGPVDLVESFSLPLPALVICQLLGVPHADQPFFQHNIEIISTVSEDSAEVAEAFGQLARYLDELTAAKEADPGEDLLGRVAARYVAAGELDHEQLVAMARLLLVAGNDATANMIAMAVLTLLRHPDQLAQLRADPGLVPSAVDELLRFLSVSQNGMVRVATADLEIGGQLIAADDGVLFSLLAANHDEDAFENASELRILRDSRSHVAFGHGAHQCLGKSLARVELQIALTSLLAAFPDISLAVDFDRLRFHFDSFVYGVDELPVFLGKEPA